MEWIIVIAGVLIIASGLAILTKPDLLRAAIHFFSIGSRLYLIGFFRLILGNLILALSSRAKPWLWGYVIIVGILLATSGLAVFFLPLRRAKVLLGRLRNQPNPKLRLLVAIALVIWALLLFALLPLPASL